MMKTRTTSDLLAVFATLFVGGGIAALVWACAPSPDPNRATVVGFTDPTGQNLDPSPAQFKDRAVSRFIERRCGTLDCHGRPERPLRIYGARGLRLPNDAGLRPTTGDTTDEEVQANYRAVVSLEPELMTRVIAAHAQGLCAIAGEAPDVPCANRLLLVAKPLSCNNASSVKCDHSKTAPRGVEHKGGAVIAEGDNGYRCLVSWLEGGADGVACQTAADVY